MPSAEVELEVSQPRGRLRRFHFSLSRQSMPDIGECTIIAGRDETERHQAQQAIAQSAIAPTFPAFRE